jgi:predicted nucleic acid-binding protein
MMVVHTSVWIDFFNGTASREASILDYYLDKQQIIIGDLILVELLQGFRHSQELRRAQTLLECLEYQDMSNKTLAYQSAQYYRSLRQKGITVRKTIDVMIATFCIENRYTLLHRDQDFDVMREHFGLQVF